MDIGISCFSTNFRGTGGEIKVYPEDFKVEEINDTGLPVSELPATEQYGLYYHIVVHRVNHNHDFMLRELQKFFEVSEDAISFAGIKDKRAEILQEAAIFQPKQTIDDHVVLSDGLDIRPLGFARISMQAGHSAGNKFTIRIQNINKVSNDELQQLQTVLTKQGVLNYYGPQRFGGVQGSTAEFGKALLQQDYKLAVHTYLSGTNGFRKLWTATHDPATVLQSDEYIPAIERKVFAALLSRPEDYRGAVAAFPAYLLNIAERAYIALLWNQYLSMRGGEKSKLKGERIMGNNIEIALPSKKWPKTLNYVWEKIFANNSITPQLFAQTRHSTRMLLLYPQNLQIQQDANTTTTVFTLPSGAYATIILREITKNY